MTHNDGQKKRQDRLSDDPLMINVDALKQKMFWFVENIS